jgi:hypothetical protein
MSKILFVACILSLISLTCGAFAASTDKVNIDVAGFINHGPMQPTIKAMYVFSWLALPLAFGDNPVLSVPRLPASS